MLQSVLSTASAVFDMQLENVFKTRWLKPAARIKRQWTAAPTSPLSPGVLCAL